MLSIKFQFYLTMLITTVVIMLSWDISAHIRACLTRIMTCPTHIRACSTYGKSRTCPMTVLGHVLLVIGHVLFYRKT